MGQKPPHLDQLPLDDAWAQLEGALKEHQNLVLVAEPGAGKTTRFPPSLLRSGLIPANKKILMLEPRRLAARASAHRIAEEQGWSLGNEVGYQVRFENRSTPATRLVVLTEGLLGRRLLGDPELKDVGAVILDEFHERSQHTDLALALLFELQQLSRPDLRIIVMSATLDAEKVASYLLDCPIVKVPGRTHPVTIHHGKKPLMLDTGYDFLDGVASTVLDAVEGNSPREGDVLVFLPGAREIRGVAERVGARAERARFTCFELHGSLALEDQDRAIRKLPDRNKIVLATNIAETSLTIDGVGTVIDTGLARVVRTDALGFPRLQVSRISLASATQRAGRAGRQGPGHCYRLWNKIDEASMPPFEVPEILRSDLAEPLMSLLAQGVTDPFAFSWFEEPPRESLLQALAFLTDLGFREGKTGQLTSEGREALKLPIAPRLARLLLESTRAGSPKLGAKLAALLSERDIAMRAADLKRSAKIESDPLIRLQLLEERSAQVDRIAARNVERVADQLESATSRIDRKVLAPAPQALKGLASDDLALRLLLLAYPDRLTKRRRAKEPAGRMVGGKGVTLAPFSSVETADLFLSIDSNEKPGAARSADPQITIASYVERAWVESLFPHAISKGGQVVFDEETKSAQKQLATSFRDLPLEEAKIMRPTADEALPILIEACRSRWPIICQQNEDLGKQMERLRFMTENLPEREESKVDLAAVETSLLEEACFGETRIENVVSKPLGEIFLRYLPPATARVLSEAVPDAITVPSGSRIRIHYPEGRAPYLEVRIQEIFGMRSVPKIALGRVPIVLHLLGPNFRPVQVTSDLESFWQNGYTEVRKELRSRYPKHSWPDDPLTARPEAKGRRRT